MCCRGWCRLLTAGLLATINRRVRHPRPKGRKKTTTRLFLLTAIRYSAQPSKAKCRRWLRKCRAHLGTRTSETHWGLGLTGLSNSWVSTSAWSQVTNQTAGNRQRLGSAPSLRGTGGHRLLLPLCSTPAIGALPPKELETSLQLHLPRSLGYGPSRNEING